LNEQKIKTKNGLDRWDRRTVFEILRRNENYKALAEVEETP